MAIELVKKNYSQAKVTAMVIDARPARMAGGKSLPRVENERVVSILKKLLPASILQHQSSSLDRGHVSHDADRAARGMGRAVAEARTDPNRVSKRVSTKPVSRATIASNQASLCVYFFDPWV